MPKESGIEAMWYGQNRLFPFILMLAVGFSSPASAESVYVSDMLRVGVRAVPDSSVAPIGVVLTGMKLEVLERRGGYLKITTEKGLTGWIKDIYVIEAAPAIIQLKSLESRHDETVAQVASLEENIKLLEETNSGLNKKVDELESERSKLQLQLTQDKAQEKRNIRPLWWLLVAVLIALFGFIGGIYWYRQQTMKRLGGLRV